MKIFKNIVTCCNTSSDALMMTSTHLKELTSFLSKEQIFTDQKNLEFYGKDWMPFFKPNPLCIVFPKKTQDLVQLVQLGEKT